MFKFIHFTAENIVFDEIDTYLNISNNINANPYYGEKKIKINIQHYP
jgi:hypothetical protein